MADALYPSYKESLLDGTAPDLATDTIKIALVNLSTDYTYSAAHDFLDDVTRYSGTTDQTLASKTVASGVFDAANPVFSSVAIDGSKDVEAYIIYQDTGNAATSPLICFSDSPVDVTPNGGDITTVFGANIFSI